jgi:hypothetical protein
MYGKGTPSRPHVEWHEMLEGREKLEDKQPSHPTTLKKLS